ncbi:unnamed protein product [Cochlearia groenlandica]
MMTCCAITSEASKQISNGSCSTKNATLMILEQHEEEDLHAPRNLQVLLNRKEKDDATTLYHDPSSNLLSSLLNFSFLYFFSESFSLSFSATFSCVEEDDNRGCKASYVTNLIHQRLGAFSSHKPS